MDTSLADLIKEIIVEVLSISANSFGGTLAAIVAGWLYSVFLLLCLVIIVAVYYIISAKAISKIARDKGLTNHRIFAWIPILRVVRLFEIIEFKLPWWLDFFIVVYLLMFFQVFLFIMILGLWIKIAYTYLKSVEEAAILGLLLGLPGLNIILAIYFAYCYKEEHVTKKSSNTASSSSGEILPLVEQNNTAQTGSKQDIEKT